MGSTRQRKTLIIVSLVCCLVLLLAQAALNAFRLSSLNPVTTSQIVTFVAISLVAFLLFVGALILLVRNALKLYAEQRSRVLGRACAQECCGARSCCRSCPSRFCLSSAIW